eukprot:824072-Amphidinium_carterae.6
MLRISHRRKDRRRGTCALRLSHWEQSANDEGEEDTGQERVTNLLSVADLVETGHRVVFERTNGADASNKLHGTQ